MARAASKSNDLLIRLLKEITSQIAVVSKFFYLVSKIKFKEEMHSEIVKWKFIWLLRSVPRPNRKVQLQYMNRDSRNDDKLWNTCIERAWFQLSGLEVMLFAVLDAN